MSGWVAAAIATSAVISSQASKSAAKTAAAGAEKASDTQLQMFERSVELQEPWRKAGMEALNKLIPLASEYKPFTAANMYADPGYQFRLSEGLKAMERGAAARGGLQSGTALKAAQRYGQEYASGEYTNAFNRYQAERAAQLNPLQSLAGVGQTTASQLGTQAVNVGANIGQAQQSAAQARASGYLGGANALTGALGTGLNYYQNQQWMNRLFPQGSGSPQYTYGEGYIPYGTSYGE